MLERTEFRILKSENGSTTFSINNFREQKKNSLRNILFWPFRASFVNAHFRIGTQKLNIVNKTHFKNKFPLSFLGRLGFWIYSSLARLTEFVNVYFFVVSGQNDFISEESFICP